MKIAISIPNELFEQAEKVARDLDRSRSALSAKALSEMLAQLRDEATTAQLNESLKETPITADPAYTLYMRRELERNGGKW